MNPVTHPGVSADQVEATLNMLADPKFWILLIIYCIVHSLVAATIKHFRK